MKTAALTLAGLACLALAARTLSARWSWAGVLALMGAGVLFML